MWGGGGWGAVCGMEGEGGLRGYKEVLVHISFGSVVVVVSIQAKL